MLLLSVLFNVAQTKEPLVLVAPPIGQGTGFAARPDGKQAVSVDPHGDGMVWANDKGGPVPVGHFTLAPVYADAKGFTNYQIDPYKLAISPDGERLLVVHPTTWECRLYALHPFRLLWSKKPNAPRWQPQWTPKGDAILIEGLTADNRKRVTVRVSPETGVESPFPIGAPYAFTKDGRRVAGFTKKGAALAEVATGRVLRRFEEKLETLGPIGISPDERYLVTGGEDPDWRGPQPGPDEPPPTEASFAHEYRTKIWSMATGRRTRLLPGEWQNQHHPLDPVFLPKGRVTFLDSGRIYRLADGRPVGKFKSPPGDPYGFQKWWSPNPKAPLHPTQFQLPNLLSPPTFARPLEGGRLGVVSGGYFWAFDLKAGKRLAAESIMPVNGVTQMVTRDDGSLVVAGLNGVRIFSPDLIQHRLVSPPKVNDEFGMMSAGRPVLLPGGREAIESDGVMGKSRRWVVGTGKVLGPGPETLGASERLVYAPDGAAFRVRTWPQDASLARLGKSNRPALKGKGAADDAFSPAAVEERHGRGAAWFTPPRTMVVGPKFSEDGKLVGMMEMRSREIENPDQVFRLLDAVSGQERWQTPIEGSSEFALSPDARWVAFACPTGVEIRPIPEGPARFTVARMPDNPLIVALSARRVMLYGNGTPATIFDTETGKPVAYLATFQRGDWAAWTPDGAVDGSEAGIRWLRRPNPEGGLTAAFRNRAELVWAALSS